MSTIQTEDGYDIYAAIDDLPLDEVDPSKDVGDKQVEPATRAMLKAPPAPPMAITTSTISKQVHAKRKRVVCPHKRTIKQDDKGKDVEAVFRAVSKWEHRHGLGRYVEHPTPLYGKGKVLRMKKFQHAHGIKATGKYDLDTHHALLKFFDAWGAHLMRVYTIPNQLSGKRTIIINGMMYSYHNCGHHYTQDSYWRCEGWYKHVKPEQHMIFRNADCSGHAQWGNWLAGVTSAGPYYGWTGSMLEHGVTVSTAQCKPGDQAFYNNHVATIVSVANRSNILVISYGHEGAPFLVSLHYRDDLMTIRSYVK